MKGLEIWRGMERGKTEAGKEGKEGEGWEGLWTSASPNFSEALFPPGPWARTRALLRSVASSLLVDRPSSQGKKLVGPNRMGIVTSQTFTA